MLINGCFLKTKKATNQVFIGVISNGKVIFLCQNEVNATNIATSVDEIRTAAPSLSPLTFQTDTENKME